MWHVTRPAGQEPPAGVEVGVLKTSCSDCDRSLCVWVHVQIRQQLQVAATCCGDTSQQQIASSVLEKFCENLCICNRILSPRQVTQNTVWFDFLQLVAATKFRCRKSKNSLLHTNRFVTATCRVAATCRLVCTDLKLQRKPKKWL